MTDYFVNPQQLKIQTGALGTLRTALEQQGISLLQIALVLPKENTQMQQTAQTLQQLAEKLALEAQGLGSLGNGLNESAAAYGLLEEKNESIFRMVRDRLRQIPGLTLSQNVRQTTVRKKESTSSAALASGGLGFSTYYDYLRATGNWEYGSLQAQVGHAQANANFLAGIYQRTAQGKTVFSPEISAAAGASVSLLLASANAGIGNRWISANAQGSATVGSMGAEINAKMKLLDNQGNFHPEIKGKAEAEAIAAEAGGSVTGSLLGISATATGSVNFGVGAHAEFAIEGLKISGSVGASLGVGAEAGFVLDPEDALNNLYQIAGSVACFLMNDFFKGGEEA